MTAYYCTSCKYFELNNTDIVAMRLTDKNYLVRYKCNYKKGYLQGTESTFNTIKDWGPYRCPIVKEKEAEAEQEKEKPCPDA